MVELYTDVNTRASENLFNKTTYLSINTLDIKWHNIFYKKKEMVAIPVLFALNRWHSIYSMRIEFFALYKYFKYYRFIQLL